MLRAVGISMIPLAFLKPQVGIYLWTWIAYMNPHKVSWGIASDLNLSEIVAAVTIIAWLLAAKRQRFPWMPATILLVVFVAWCGITSLTAINSNTDQVTRELERFAKIVLFTMLTISIISNRVQLHALIWVTVISMTYYGVKGGIFGIMTGGQHTIFGPGGSFIADNNSLAMALLMTLPFVRYLQLTSDNRWIRIGLLFTSSLVLLSIVLSYSRGALLGLAATVIFLWFRSPQRLKLALATGIVLALAFSLVPQKWYSRMETIETYEDDRSANTRVGIWIFAAGIANDHPITGGGMSVFFHWPLYEKYHPGPVAHPWAPHSIYFGVLGEHGYVGLGLFLLLAIASFRNTGWVLRHTRDRPDLGWARDLAKMIQVSLVAYAVPGAFLTLQYFDLYYGIIAISVITRVIVARELAAKLEVSAQEAIQPHAASGAIGKLK